LLGVCIGAKPSSKLKARVIDDTNNPRFYTMEFTIEGIRICYGTNIIWHKPVAGLAILSDGKRLLEQLDRGLKAQGLEKEL
jgi:hypothetical protein